MIPVVAKVFIFTDMAVIWDNKVLVPNMTLTHHGFLWYFIDNLFALPENKASLVEVTIRDIRIIELCLIFPS